MGRQNSRERGQLRRDLRAQSWLPKRLEVRARPQSAMDPWWFNVRSTIPITLMSDLQAIITFVVFGSVLLVIVFNLLDMALAALLGVSTLTALGVFTLQDILNV